jgi:hypothetical protein
MRRHTLNLQLNSLSTKLGEHQTYWWMIDYNEKRPHDSLENMTPLEVMMRYTGNSTFKLST